MGTQKRLAIKKFAIEAFKLDTSSFKMLFVIALRSLFIEKWLVENYRKISIFFLILQLLRVVYKLYLINDFVRFVSLEKILLITHTLAIMAYVGFSITFFKIFI